MRDVRIAIEITLGARERRYRAFGENNYKKKNLFRNGPGSVLYIYFKLLPTALLVLQNIYVLGMTTVVGHT